MCGHPKFCEPPALQVPDLWRRSREGAGLFPDWRLRVVPEWAKEKWSFNEILNDLRPCRSQRPAMSNELVENVARSSLRNRMGRTWEAHTMKQDK